MSADARWADMLEHQMDGASMVVNDWHVAPLIGLPTEVLVVHHQSMRQ